MLQLDEKGGVFHRFTSSLIELDQRHLDLTFIDILI